MEEKGHRSLSEGESNQKPASGGKRALTVEGNKGAEDTWNVKYTGSRQQFFSGADVETA